MKSLFALIIGICLFSCEGDYGHRVVGDNLSVHYNSLEDEKMAEQIAVFWKEHDLIVDNKQDLQLVNKTDEYELRIIQSNDSAPSKLNEMPFNERKLLLDLQKDLSNSLGGVTMQIVICNSKFEPIYNINK